MSRRVVRGYILLAWLVAALLAGCQRAGPTAAGGTRNLALSGLDTRPTASLPQAFAPPLQISLATPAPFATAELPSPLIKPVMLTPAAWTPVPTRALPAATPGVQPTAAATLSPEQALGRAMLAAVNAERARSKPVTPAWTRGMPATQPAPLAWDERLAEVAARHAQDMAARGYFAHDTPEGKTAADRVREAGIAHELATENIYETSGPTPVKDAIEWLMHDPLHRDTLLNPRLTHIGVGVYVAGGQTIFVLDFIRRLGPTPTPTP